ncbi:UNVERIFIED_CONTAM: hypothetical protein HDU68_010247 [Siphonaria sp. JEL0065]|nr:hypothetical protein HDU68_010247 [Siphonaria sp. JEL0065]
MPLTSPFGNTQMHLQLTKPGSPVSLSDDISVKDLSAFSPFPSDPTSANADGSVIAPTTVGGAFVIRTVFNLAGYSLDLQLSENHPTMSADTASFTVVACPAVAVPVASNVSTAATTSTAFSVAAVVPTTKPASKASSLFLDSMLSILLFTFRV